MTNNLASEPASETGFLCKILVEDEDFSRNPVSLNAVNLGEDIVTSQSSALVEDLLTKLQKLLPEQQQQVLAFVEFMLFQQEQTFQPSNSSEVGRYRLITHCQLKQMVAQQL